MEFQDGGEILSKARRHKPDAECWFVPLERSVHDQSALSLILHVFDDRSNLSDRLRTCYKQYRLVVSHGDLRHVWIDA